MEGSNPLKDLLNGIGAAAEMAGVWRDELIRNGFTRAEACNMASKLIIAMVAGAGNQNGGTDE